MQLIDEIKNWKSTKIFSDRPVEEDKLTRILEAGRKAPSAKNRQPWRFIVLRSQMMREKMADAAYNEEHVKKAPVIVAACSTNVDYQMPNGQLSYPMDISFAVSFMMLQARAEKVGCRVITTFDEREVKEILTVPHSMRVVMLLLLGYPDEREEAVDRKPFKMVVSYDHW